MLYGFHCVAHFLISDCFGCDIYPTHIHNMVILGEEHLSVRTVSLSHQTLQPVTVHRLAESFLRHHDRQTGDTLRHGFPNLKVALQRIDIH